jgi:hypothetical protein
MLALFTVESTRGLLRRIVKGADAGAVETVLADTAMIERLAAALSRIETNIVMDPSAKIIGRTAKVLADVPTGFLEGFRPDDPCLPVLRTYLNAASIIRKRGWPYASKSIEHWNQIAKDLQGIFFAILPEAFFAALPKHKGKATSYRFVAEVWRMITGEEVDPNNIGAAFKHEEKAVKEDKKQEIGKRLPYGVKPTF